ncbi:sigma-54 interaction domain-containing protein [Anaeromyxobacter dehalogenans]|uniref:Sigma54 specific transcriptional regulator, Fis family n=1 Tax=Anaeromyxobacter dehalogenans (strain 2CP-C) TaxID=290397 RepID=Q2IJR9_ANADE|nr:sigma-54 dependent transcriptional regulator [Anaeromyxobacter dehalogenans]ABC81902.1 sigma54 specific transcriptional regulator, Fis family [Anaeromyxobacter dehalogenans 2CP-C]
MERLPVMSDACAVCGLGTVVERVRRTTHVVAESPAMQAVLVRARDFADADAPVVVLGESGTGKEVVARALHASSARGARPFVAVNVAALPAELLESELFGHVKGAFTGATAEKQGLLEAAHGGTLFLDEIGEMPLPLQAKLLRALEDGEVRRVGDTRAFGVDVRFVCATHQDLARLVAEGRFREDLYYRLKVLVLRLPPLRDRPEDVLPLARRFLAEEKRPGPGFSPEAERRLLAYRWPGNVRELGNVVRYAAAVARGAEIRPEHLPEELTAPAGPAARGGTAGEPAAMATLAEVERAHVLAVLERCGGSQAEAARVLGIGRNTLWRKLKAYDGPR